MRKLLQIGLMVVWVSAMVSCLGCATSGTGLTDEELIGKMVDKWKTALIAKDVEGTMACFSESFEHYEAPSKQALTDMLEQAYDMGMGDDMQIDLEAVQIAIEDDTATVGPIDLSTIAGSLSGNLIVTKEGGTWLISAIEVTSF